jgi:lipoprotein
MRTLFLAAALTAILLSAAGCGEKKATPPQELPKEKKALPLHICDTVYNAVDTLPVTVMVNAETGMTVPDSVTMKLRYQAYRGTLNIAAIDTGAGVVKAQTDLMMQRLGQNAAEQLRITSAGGYRTTILVATSPVAVPVQFLAVGNSKILSGYFAFDSEPEETDSLLPVIDALRRDMIFAAENFK